MCGDLFLYATFAKQFRKMTLLFIGTSELIVVLLVVLLFFGSKRIPQVARDLGRGIRHFRDATNEIQRDITDSVREVKKTIDQKNDPS